MNDEIGLHNKQKREVTLITTALIMNAREEATKNGHPKRRRRSDGVGKPKAHKKGGGNTSGQSRRHTETTDVVVETITH